MSNDARLIFVIGCVRSGTTWLQTLLEQHPQVASTQETYLFSGYLAKLYERWDFETGRRQDTRVGIQHLIDEQTFDDLCRHISDTVLQRICENKPEASVILEKTPNNAFFTDLIRRLYPQARFLYLYRDPRSVAASIMAAARSWGKHWASEGPVNAALTWQRWMLEMEQQCSKQDCTVVRYEALKQDTPMELSRILGWIGLTSDTESVQSYIQASTPEALRKQGSDLIPAAEGNNTSFVRSATVDSWKQDLSSADIRIIEHINGELMQRHGYQPSLKPRPVPPARVLLYRALDEFSNTVSYRSKRWRDCL